MINVNDYKGNTDSEIFEAAMADLGSDGILVIPPRECANEPERDYWLIDRAILIPENTTVILQNATIKLSDKCRDNFFRSANCGIGIEFPEKIKNVHIKGEGLCTLVGADHPRATGDGSKVISNPCPYLDEDICKYAHWIDDDRRSPEKLTFADRHGYSYGTDAGKEGESQRGDWRGIGILFANVENFSIENLTIKESHGWGISVEACAYGRIEKIIFDARMSKMIDGMLHNMENEDGVDIRNGCHHITISDISGQTGDDIVALTAIVPNTFNYKPGGSLCTTHVMHNDYTKRDRDIYDIIIRNVVGYSQLCHNVRLLACNTKIYNVVIDGIVDTSPEGHVHSTAITIGDYDAAYGSNKEDGVTNVTISNVICKSRNAIRILGYLKDSCISNVINRNPDCPVILSVRPNGLVNVKMSNLVSAGDVLVKEA